VDAGAKKKSLPKKSNNSSVKILYFEFVSRNFFLFDSICSAVNILIIF